MVNVRVGRVNILLLYTLRAGIEQPPAKPNNLSAYAKPWKNNTACKAIDISSIIGAITKTRLHQEVYVISLVDSCACQQLSVVKVEA